MNNFERYAKAVHNMTNHPPVDKGVVNTMESVRTSCLQAARSIIDNCPDSDEREKALDALELAVMHAIAAIARHQ